MLKFISSKEEVITYEKPYNEIDESLSPFKEILKKADYSSFSFADEEGGIDNFSLGESFHLQVNAKGIGTFHFIFKAEGFSREMVDKDISTLKEFKVHDYESAKYKVTTLINIVKEYKPLFLVYKEGDNSHFYTGELQNIIAQAFPAFVIAKQEQKEEVKELDIGVFKPEDILESNRYQKKKKKFSFGKINKKVIINELANNKFHLLLVFISTLLIQVSIPLAIFNIYAKNALYVFLFICGALGLGMNAYSYFDYFKHNNIKSPLFIFSVIANLIGLGSGIGVFAIFYNISTKVESAPGIGSFIWIGVLITMIVVSASITIVYFIRKKPKPKK